MSVVTIDQGDLTIVDADSHVYEPEAIWDDYIASEQSTVARSAFFHCVDDVGNTLTILNGVPAKELNRAKLIRQAIWRPGSTEESIGDLDPNTFHDLNPGAFDPTARLADMDALGIDAAVVYPTLFAEYLPLVENPLAASILASAYNDWIADFCSAARDRLHPVAVLPLQSMAYTRKELERVAGRGFKAAMLRPMFYRGAMPEPIAGMTQMQSTGESAAFLPQHRGIFLQHPHFEPLWRQIADLDLTACIHPSVGSTNPHGTSAGTFVEHVSENLPVGHSVAESVAYLQDTGVFVTAMAFHGLLEDLPSLRIALVHSGASMVPLALEKAETYLWVSPSSAFGMSRPVSLEPREVVERRPIVMSFDSWETAVGEMADPMYGTKAVWGSRYPHHDASSPADALAMLEASGTSPEVIARLMGGNCADLFGLSVERVATMGRRS